MSPLKIQTIRTIKMLKETEGLYPLISKMVEERINSAFTGKKLGSLQSLTGVAVQSNRTFNETVNEMIKLFAKKADLVEVSAKLDDLAQSLAYMVPEKIVTGLDVTADSPPSMNINISAGYGGARGRPCRLDDAKQVRIPTSDIPVYYVQLQSYGQVNITPNDDPESLTLAKIIIPKPGTTLAIQNDKVETVDSYDGYIISAKDMYFGEDQEFDDASLEVMRDAIGDILADNIVGNIRLSEDLKIINTAGTLELNSNSVKITDEDGNRLAEFNSNGTYFYNTAGTEVARFSSNEARIGNMKITPTTMESVPFSSGPFGTGFRIQDSGDAEFNNIYLRGKLGASVFEYNTISAVGGNVLISKDADKLDADMTTSATTLTTTGDVEFAVGDFLEMKTGAVEIEYFEVTGVTSATTYTVTRDKGSTGALAWKKGTAIVNLGASGDGGIYMTASESNAPYISVFTHAGAPWSTLTTRARLGNLNGYLGYSTDLYGIAIGETDAYLKYDPTNGMAIKGSITVTGGDASKTFYQATEPSGEGEKDGDFWVDTDDDDKLYVYNSGAWAAAGATGGIESFRQSAIPTALNAGDLWIDTDDDKLYRATNAGDDQITAGEWELQNAAIATGWSHGSDVTKIDGGDVYTGSITAAKITVTNLSALSADLGTITAGLVTGATIRTAASGSRVELYSDASTGLIAYDDSANEIFKVLIGGANVGDVVIGDYSNSKGLFWDKSAGKFTVKGTMNIGAAGSVYLDGDNQVIKVYDTTPNLRVEIGLLS